MTHALNLTSETKCGTVGNLALCRFKQFSIATNRQTARELSRAEHNSIPVLATARRSPPLAASLAFQAPQCKP
jgi:hypothetical protein